MSGAAHLVVDAGGSSLRASLVEEGGGVVARAVRPMPEVIDAPPLGRSYDTKVLWAAMCEATREVLHAHHGEVAAVAVTGQRIACVAADARGVPVYAGPNTDSRGLAHGWEVDAAADGSLYDHTGRGLALLYAPARLLWLRDHRPADLERVTTVLGLADWLAMQLCGEASVDPCTALDLLALDPAGSRVRCDALWTRLGLDPAWVPLPQPAGSPLGAVDAAAAEATGIRSGTPVAVCTPDSMAALLGAGMLDPGGTLVLAGSTMPVLGLSARPAPVDAARRTWRGLHPAGRAALVESNAGVVGFGWAWLVERVVGEIAGVDGAAAYALAERLASDAPAGSGEALGLLGGASVAHATRPSSFLPRFHAAAWPSALLGSDLGAGEVLRSALEGVAHAARANVEQVEAVRGGSEAVALAGGMARSRLLPQILADLLRRPLRCHGDGDVTAAGAAACAAVAAGHHRDLEEAARALACPAATVDPEPSRAAVYGAAHREWRALYERMESL